MKIVDKGYSREEMETTCNYDYVNGEWDIYTTVPKHITKLLKQYGDKVEVLEKIDGGREVAVRVTIQEDIITFRRVLTQEEKDKKAKGLKK